MLLFVVIMIRNRKIGAEHFLNTFVLSSLEMKTDISLAENFQFRSRRSFDAKIIKIGF